MRHCSIIVVLFIQEDIMKRPNSDNACYHSVQNLLSSRLLPKNVKTRKKKTVLLSVVLYECKNLVSDIQRGTQIEGV
jgi:hypothetical protein